MHQPGGQAARQPLADLEPVAAYDGVEIAPGYAQQTVAQEASNQVAGGLTRGGAQSACQRFIEQCEESRIGRTHVDRA